ncbi:thiamine phosphate synthase [Hydrogenothermus marinus]|uniref:Thiamine-phosphate pyrophosphorylase n=1 Tax=Hydrogenothermus marinus TaxID=133270 RepID=A0A3M0BLG4_9AQUI|nr:thiamine phosphate synthase [Hydrogenothermus marinus]RMA97294.1 thiamine-phosphate pyrophosphorylase [Hydrogenothermus marinus]
MKNNLHKFYAITDRKKYKIPFENQIKLLLDKGIRMFQLREKDLSSGELLNLAEKMKRILEKYNGSLFINDRVDVALLVEADGVHLPENSFPVSKIKTKFPHLIVGKSCHSIECAIKAQEEGADYIIFSPIFYVEGKGKPQGIKKLKEVVERVNIPVYALGGINKSNINQVLDTGVYGIAGIRTFLY